MRDLQNIHRIVVKIGTSTLTHHNTGHLNLKRIEILVRTLSDLKNEGREIALVSSGAVGAGVARIGKGRPQSTPEKQAMAAVGQSELMNLYSRFFTEYGQTVAQILLTKDVMDIPERRAAAADTFGTLFKMGCLPIVNENDSVSTEGLNFGGNDILAAYVAGITHADLLINMSDVDGLFDSDPRKNPQAKRIPFVEKLDDRIFSMAGGAGTASGTGGMTAKLCAAKLSLDAGVPMCILNGQDPEVLYALLAGEEIGTYFAAQKAE